jgi:hypothetical protein
MLQFGFGGILQALWPKVQFTSSIISWVLALSCQTMGAFHATCEKFWFSMWNCLIVFMNLIYDLSSFENACKSST